MCSNTQHPSASSPTERLLPQRDEQVDNQLDYSKADKSLRVQSSENSRLVACQYIDVVRYIEL